MPIDKYNQRSMMTRLYTGLGMLQKLTLLKRGPDQQQGTVTAYTLFNCRRGKISRTGQTLDGDMSSGNKVTWHIPQEELERVGVHYVTALDRLVDGEGGTGTWQPEANTEVREKLLKTHVCVDCLQLAKGN